MPRQGTRRGREVVPVWTGEVFAAPTERSVTLEDSPSPGVIRLSASLATPSDPHEVSTDLFPHLFARAIEAADTPQANANLPFIVVGCIIGGLLVLFAVAATVIHLRGRKYKSLDKPAPEGLQVETGETKAQRKTLEISRAAANAFSDLPRRDPLEKTKYGEAMKRKPNAGDVLPKHRQRHSLVSKVEKKDDRVSLLSDAAPVPLSSPPKPTPSQEDTPPAPPPKSVASKPPSYADHLALAQPVSTASASNHHHETTLSSASQIEEKAALRGLSKTPPLAKLAISEEKTLPNPWEIRMSQMLVTPADDRALPNPYADTPSHLSPSRADSPDPYAAVAGKLPPLPRPASSGPVTMPAAVAPLRVQKGKRAETSTSRPLPNPHLYGTAPEHPRASTFDMARSSRNSSLYSLPALDISSASLSLSLKSSKAGSVRDLRNVER